jgi:hypothetical protein
LLPCELPERSILFADKAYTDYAFEDDLKEMVGFQLIPSETVAFCAPYREITFVM